MVKSNAERVSAWRTRQLADDDKASAYRAKRADTARAKRQKDADKIAELQQRLNDSQAQEARSVSVAMETMEQNENLRRYSKGLATRIRRLEQHIDTFTAEDMTEETWERLAAMNDFRLRQWVLLGRKMASIDHDAPVNNAIRWVEANTLENLTML